MLAASEGHWEVCVKLAELGADLNLADQGSEACSDWAEPLLSKAAEFSKVTSAFQLQERNNSPMSGLPKVDNTHSGSMILSFLA